MVQCIDNNNLGIELFSDASCDSEDPFIGGNQESSNKVRNAPKQRRKGIMVQEKIMNL